MKTATYYIASFAIGAVLFTAATVVYAWTGPGSSPPNSNVFAPVHVGAGDQFKTATLGVNSLVVDGNAILSGATRYLNFNATPGSGGYGFRDSAGVMQVKNSNGAWAAIATSTASGADNMGNHSMTQRLYTNGNWIGANATYPNLIYVGDGQGVGIKDTNPGGYALSVNGILAAKELVMQSLTASVNILLSGEDTGRSYIQMFTGNGDNKYWTLGTYNRTNANTSYRNALRLTYFNNASTINALIFDTTGQMGVGMADPANVNYDLEVDGTAGKNDGSTVWSNASDARLKDVLGKYSKGLSEILKLNPVEFRYKIDNARQMPTEKNHAGLVAQEVEKVFPDAVTIGEDGYRDLDVHSINIALINAVKELKAENDALRSRLDALEKRVE